MSKNTDQSVHDGEAASGVLRKVFSKKYRSNEKIKTMIKQPKFWSALLGELIGTMLLTSAFLFIIGVFRADYVPITLFGATIATYVVFYKISGAQLNPLVTAGAMATRRMSIVRGIFYMLAQFTGAWLGFLIVILFKNGSGSDLEIPASLIGVDGESFWAVALIELMGAIILGFLYSRSTQLKKRNSLTYAILMTCGVILLYLFGAVISQSYFGMYENLVFNPAAASTYSIFANLTDGFGQVILISLAYLILPMAGGIVGCYLSELTTVLVGEGYSCADECNDKKVA